VHDLAEETMDDRSKSPSWIELESVLPLESSKGETNVKQITGLSGDTVQRRFPQYVTKLSPRRVGMKLRHALTIADGLK
jgi:hypothetical protein